MSKALSEVIESWNAWAYSAGFDERNPDLRACIKEIKEAYDREAAKERE